MAFPKKLAAACKMSLARRSSKFSLRRRLSSACSSVVNPGRLPASTSARLTQLRSDSSPTPSWRATREITVLSCGSCSRRSCTMRTARSFSSGGYRFVVGLFSMTPSSLPRYEASRIPRPIHTGTPPSPSPPGSRSISAIPTVRGRGLEREHHWLAAPAYMPKGTDLSRLAPRIRPPSKEASMAVPARPSDT